MGLIEQAKEQGISRDQFKSEILRQIAPQSKFRLRGAAGERALGAYAGEVFKEIDELWKQSDDITPEIIVKH